MKSQGLGSSGSEGVRIKSEHASFASLRTPDQISGPNPYQLLAHRPPSAPTPGLTQLTPIGGGARGNRAQVNKPQGIQPRVRTGATIMSRRKALQNASSNDSDRRRDAFFFPSSLLPPALTGGSHPLTTALFHIIRSYLLPLLACALRRCVPGTCLDRANLLPSSFARVVTGIGDDDSPRLRQSRHLKSPLPPADTRHDRIVATPPHFFSLSFPQLLVATTLNHLRRAFVPWLGSYSYCSTWSPCHPLEDLRLALSNPDVFLAQMLGHHQYYHPCRGSLCWWVVLVVGAGDWQKVVFDAVLGEEGLLLMSRSSFRAAAQGRRVVLWSDVMRVGYLVWVLATIEYVVARGMNTAAWLVACYKLLAGGEVEHTALGNVLGENWVRVPLAAWQVVHYLVGGWLPLVWLSHRCASRGQPGLLIIVLGAVLSVVALIRYRRTFYIALEISDMFVFFGFLLGGLTALSLGPALDALGSDGHNSAVGLEGTKQGVLLRRERAKRRERKKRVLPRRHAAEYAGVMEFKELGDSPLTG